MTQITLENPKIKTYLEEKDELVKNGRKISVEIEALEKKLAANDKKQRELTEKIVPEELIKKGEALQAKINKDLAELNEMGNEIMKAKLDGIPEEVKKEFFTLKGELEAKEKERNKIALKVQKIKDRVIPLIQRETKSQLAEFEDIEAAEVVRGTVIVKTFNHLDDFKKRYLAKK